MTNFQTVRGMRDLLYEETRQLNGVTEKARKVAELFGYKEVKTPLVESYELLSVKSGEEIRSRMFTFADLGGRRVALRPEFTSSIARLVSAKLKNEPKPLRIFSVGRAYRYDEPQRGRHREFWQSNFELMGSNKPESDAEVLLLTETLIKATGLRHYYFKIGHVGILREILRHENVDEKNQNSILQSMDNKKYKEAFRLIESKKCRSVFQGLMDLKSKSPIEALVKIRKHLKGFEKALIATENLTRILRLAIESGLENIMLEPGFARGLEYYTGMIFEIYIPNLDIALGGGGRYDSLIEVFGGGSIPAVGVAHGLDRVVLALQTQNVKQEKERKKRVIVIPVNETLKSQALGISQKLRKVGIQTEVEVMGRRVNKALEAANRRRIEYAVIVGNKELEKNSIVIRDLIKHEQNTVKISKLIGKIKGGG